MPTHGKPTLTQFLIEQRRPLPGATGDLNALVTNVSLACKAIARKVAHGTLRGGLGAVGAPDEQEALDVTSNALFLRANEWGGTLAGMASEALEAPYVLPPQFHRGKYL